MPNKTLRTKRTQRFLFALASFLYQHTVLCLVSFLTLTLIFGILAAKLKQKTTLRDLLPENDQVVRNFEETVRDFDLVDRVVVVLEFEPENLEAAQSFADLFVEQIQEQVETREYLHWMKANLFDQSNNSEWFEYLQFLTRLLPGERIPDLIERLSPAQMDQQIMENRRDLASGVSSKVLIEKDPLNLLEFAGTYLTEITGNYQIEFPDGFLVSKDRSMLLILGKPTKSPEDVDFSSALDGFLKQQIEATKVIMREEEEVEPNDLFVVGLTGPHPITAHENKVIKGDVINMFLTSFFFVLLLFVLAYGRPWALFYVGFPLLCAEIWTLGIGYLLFGRLNLLTAAFSAIIVGLGIDYAIHIFSRYLDERHHKKTVLVSMQLALSETGLGTAVGGLTTALAFLAMGLGNFAGLKEFSSIAAIGIVICLIQMFVLLPCLLFIREKFKGGQGSFHYRAQRDFHLEKLLKLVLTYKGFVLSALFLGTLFFVYHAVHLRFTSDIRSVRARSNPSINLQSRVTAKVGGSLRSLTFVLKAESESELYALHDKMIPVLQKLKQDGDLVRFDSLLAVLQNKSDQMKNQEAIRAAGLTGAEVNSDFREAMSRHQMKVTTDSAHYIENLAKSLDANDPVTLAGIYEKHKPFVRPFLFIQDQHLKTVIHVYPSQGLWRKDATRVLTQQILDAVAPGDGATIFVTGIQTIADEIKEQVRESFQTSTMIAFALVFLILFLHFRKITLIILTLVPLMIAVVWMLGAMRLMGIDITILNFVVTPLIIGIGIDDGVHIVEKYLHRGSGNMLKTIASCGKAVTLTSLTTIFGFSSLFMAEYSGFQSLGICAILGVFFCWLGSVILLPLLMDLFKVKFVRTDFQAKPKIAKKA